MRPRCPLWLKLAVVPLLAFCANAVAAPPTHPGWPTASGINMGAPISADLDGDGKQELLWGERFKLMVRSEDGRLFRGWPRAFLETAGGPPSVTMLDGAPIVGIYSHDFNAGRGQVSLWRAHGEPLPGWPKTFDSGNAQGVPRYMPLVFADMDGDGRPEVIYISSTAADRSGTAVLHVDRIDGTALPGWPVTLPAAQNIYDGSPAVADVDGDGRFDIAVVTHADRIYLYDHNGVLFAGWPVIQQRSGATAANFVSFADVNGDAELDLVVITGGRIGVYDLSGQALAGWPRTTSDYASPPAFSDLENDGRWTSENPKLEIAFGTATGLSVLRADGTHFPGWPKATAGSAFSVALVDLDSDQMVDVLATDFARNVYAFNSAGTPLTTLGFPFQISGNFGGGSAPSVADIDRDGLIEFFALGGDSRIHLWDLRTTFNPLLMRSPVSMGGNQHTSRYAPNPIAFISHGPAYVSTDNASQFTVNGTGFLKGMRAFIGDREQQVSDITATTLTVTASNVPIPSGGFALYPLRVENLNSGSSEPLVDGVWVWRSSTTPTPTPTPTASPSPTPRPALTLHRQSPGRRGVSSSDGVTITVADDFEFNQDTFITRIRWWGGYYNTPPAADYFTLRIFADEGSGPGALIRALDIESIAKVRTGFNSGITAEIEYAADLRAPFLARGGVRYWLSIATPPDSVWGWDISDDQNFSRGWRSWRGRTADNISDPVNGPWEAYYDDMAFQLESTSGGLANISTRGQVESSDNTLIAGFIVTGNDPTRLLIRAIGPSLNALGVPGALENPTLALHDGRGVAIAHNNEWRQPQLSDVLPPNQIAEIEATGAAPTDPRESAMIAMLEPNSSYTLVVRGIAGSTGIAVAEVYDLHYGSVARLANISTRGFVQSGDQAMIGGFIIRNPSTRVIVRALGPSLASFGVTNPLADPFLELRNSNGTLLALNDSWRSDQESEIIATNVPPANELEAAVVMDLPAGAFTGIMRDANGSTGIGLIEVYHLDP